MGFGLKSMINAQNHRRKSVKELGTSRKFFDGQIRVPITDHFGALYHQIRGSEG